VIGAAPHRRTDARTAQRIGSRPRTLPTTAGDLELRIPKLRAGSFFPSLLERPRRIDQALFAVVMEAYLHGVSPRKVDDLVRALVADTGISQFRGVPDLRRSGRRSRRVRRPVDGRAGVPVGVPRRDLLQGQGQPPGRVPGGRHRHRRRVRRAPGGARFAVGDSEDGAFLPAFPRSLKARGLGGVQLVISDAHAGLKAAIGAVLLGASWQRCRVHVMRNVLARVPKSTPRWSPPRSARSSPSPTPSTCTPSSTSSPGMLGRQFPEVEAMLREAEDDLLAFTGFPVAHSEVDLVDQSTRAAEQGDQAAHRRRRRLPQPRSPAPPGRRRAGRSA